MNCDIEQRLTSPRVRFVHPLNNRLACQNYDRILGIGVAASSSGIIASRISFFAVTLGIRRD